MKTDRRLPSTTTARRKNVVADCLASGFSAHQSGRLDEAARLYRCALQWHPDEPDALYLLGTIALQKRDLPEAVRWFERAVRANPRHPACWVNLGLVRKDLGDLSGAEAAQRKAIELQPGFAEAHNNLGVVLAARGAFGPAVQCFRRAVSLCADYHDAWVNLGTALAARGRRNDAVVALKRAIALRPQAAHALAVLGAVLGELGMSIPAKDHVDRAAHLSPKNPDILAFRGVVLARNGETQAALANLERALDIDPNHVQARFHRCMAQIPILYHDEEEIAAARRRYECALLDLAEFCRTSSAERLWPIVQAVGSAQPFHLAYQGKNDVDLQRVYGAMVCDVMARAWPQFSRRPSMPSRGRDGRIRVGVVSGFFRHHSNWKLPIKGWVQHLDRKRFSVFGYHTQDTCDDQTRAAAGMLDKLVQGPLDLEQWCDAILADRPHVLLFPEIGMDPMTPRLAALRLAPVQCASWGHPMTTGFPTIDWFLSSDLMEPEDAQQHYSERLVRLPNLSISYEPLRTAVPAITRQHFGLSPDDVAYWCCQSLYKYLPQHDELFPQIAQRVPHARFVFLRYPDPSPLTALFQERLRKAFARHGLPADRYCVFLPRLSAGEFAATTRLMDVFLDSVGWSGCNSALEAIDAGLPVVTLRGSTLRANHCAAILRFMGHSDSVATTREQFVDFAAHLGLDAAWRQEQAARVQRDRHRIDHDMEPIRALEAFLERACESGDVVDGPPGEVPWIERGIRPGELHA